MTRRKDREPLLLRAAERPLLGTVPRAPFLREDTAGGLPA
ncbi:hypothetical protein SAMN05421803_101891 [Nocardiopsis flavescens]|uniref:Uncharacterized protein n=1 Tax=Nocardiopsis flavescens TaxID=758803 RepID=A0A1M6D1E0_9ACTN|nr:hypothetical protein SAMN05421803_101891 [Nocardiopsis flavescens]